MDPPPELSGWIKKRARSAVFANWKKRYAIVKLGKIIYYEKYNLKTGPTNPKGEMTLTGALVLSSEESGEASNRIFISGSQSEKDLLLECSDQSTAKEWIRVISLHCSFATENPDSVDSEGVNRESIMGFKYIFQLLLLILTL